MKFNKGEIVIFKVGWENSGGEEKYTATDAHRVDCLRKGTVKSWVKERGFGQSRLGGTRTI